MNVRAGHGRIAPRDAAAAPLDVVIGIMAFLAALALCAALVAERAAEGWREGLADRLTVQVLPQQQGDVRAELAQETQVAAAVLAHTDGIAGVRPLSEPEIQSLVEPWIGKGAIIEDLPLPSLIDATILPGVKVDLNDLARRLHQAAPDSVLDDHTRWIGRLKGLADSIVWSAYFILALTAIATAATVAFATRAGLEAHEDIVALLHQMGAQSRFIARTFEWHYLISALFAAAVGAVIAAVLFGMAGGFALGMEPVPFLPAMALHASGVAWIVTIPLAAALIAWATARLSVLATVNRIY